MEPAGERIVRRGFGLVRLRGGGGSQWRGHTLGGENRAAVPVAVQPANRLRPLGDGFACVALEGHAWEARNRGRAG